MPLDQFQLQILRTLSKSRSPQSVFAGGSVLQHHGFRLSDDQDIFHDAYTDVLSIAASDVANLEEAGFEVEYALKHEGLAEATVYSQVHGASKIQWVEAGSFHFFEPVQDNELGWRLHMADIATGKVLAAGGRRQVRDYVDLTLVHENILPLWHALWAAPGKDASWSPLSLAEQIAKKNQFAQAELDSEVSSMIELSSHSIGATIREALNEAREAFELLPAQTAGCLFVDEGGVIATDVASIIGTDRFKPIPATHGGTFPSGPDIDRALITKLVDAYGYNGTKLSGADPANDEPAPFPDGP